MQRQNPGAAERGEHATPFDLPLLTVEPSFNVMSVRLSHCQSTCLDSVSLCARVGGVYAGIANHTQPANIIAKSIAIINLIMTEKQKYDAIGICATACGE